MRYALHVYIYTSIHTWFYYKTIYCSKQSIWQNMLVIHIKSSIICILALISFIFNPRQILVTSQTNFSLLNSSSLTYVLNLLHVFHFYC